MRPGARARKNLGLMMREGLLKETSTGEALDWAHKRLLGRSEQRKILMIDFGRPPRSTIPHCRSIPAIISSGICAISSRKSRPVAGRTDRDRHRPRRHALLSPRGHHRDAEELGGAITEKLAELFSETSGAAPGQDRPQERSQAQTAFVV